jgi:type IV pilus assembly protein PilC
VFSNRLPLKVLSPWCRALRHGVDIGLPLGKIFRQQAKSGPPAGRTLAATLAERVEDGQSLREALKPDARRFPVLFVELVGVGERAGRLTETFITLEEHFDTLIDANRKFAQALVYPLMMYLAAVVVIAVMLLVLGLLAPADGKGFDPLGLGLLGPTGAAIWLAFAGGFTAAIYVGFQYVKSNEELRARGEALALKVPGLAGCFRAFALHRFALGLHMTSEAGIKADKSLALSFRATSNRAYTAHGDAAARSAREGNKIAPTLSACGETLFPADYVDAVHVGEETGRLPDVMARQARQYQEEAARKMKVLAMLAGAAVYAMVGLMVIALIVRLLMSIGGVYADAMKGL